MAIDTRIRVWVSFDPWSGYYHIQDEPVTGGVYQPVLMTRHQYARLRLVKKLQHNAQQYLMKVLGLKQEWSNGPDTEPEPDEECLFGKLDE